MTLSQRRYIWGLSIFDNMDDFESFESLQNNAIAAPP
jgi:hypothetical protein